MDSAFLVYLICFGVGFLFVLVSGFMAGPAGGHGEPSGHDAGHGHGVSHGAFDGDGHGMPSFSPWNPMLLASFLTAFGGLGMLFNEVEATKNPLISAPLAGIGALAVATLIFWLFCMIFRRTQASSESQVNQLTGQTAILNTPLPEHGMGEIAYIHGGVRYTAPARAEDGRALAQGATVRITRIAGSDFFVTAA
jgi:membrane protein implicated in regulation of membrane protease activity